MHDRRIQEPWGERTPYTAGEPWPVRVDEYLDPDVDHVDRWVQSASVLHSNGDAMDIAVTDDRIVGVRGRAADRVNRGRLGPKDLYGWQANNSPDRLTRPKIRRDGELIDCDWDTAMGEVVARSHAVLDYVGPDGIGFYTSGQLFLEEYYTLTVLARAGIGTNHLDGNTRLCTATSAEALKQTFGSDGQPGSYTDVDTADVIVLFGHNVAATQTVLWSRMADRLAGRTPPTVICVDPRTTAVARASGLHLAPIPGTNLALMNALLHEIIANGWIDSEYIGAHTVGFDALAERVSAYTPEHAAGICGLDPADIRTAARHIGTARRLFSTVLQGFYQSNQATAAAVQVNNIHLVRGMLGRPGCGILQMNGQPTAQNTRECGANGDFPGFRNWANRNHLADLAALWNVDVDKIDHGKPPTHALEIFDRAERGDLKFLWISATNPAVSLPDLARVRRILARPEVFVVVSDIFDTETTALADVVLPAATWGEKTGAFTNADRTVHISDRAVPPPGLARSDLDIFLDYAARMDLRDRDGASLISWSTPDEAFEAWKQCSQGRPCDYSAMTYDMLRTGSGVQWPCTAAQPGGTERLYTDGGFPSAPDYCETYGKDLRTGDPATRDDYIALNPDARAVIRSADFEPAPEVADDDYPFSLITGRSLFHFHTRTKTARAPQLHAAEPEVWVEISPIDAGRLGITAGDVLDIVTRRGRVRAPARVGGIRAGVVFLPFHYGYFDADPAAPEAHHRAANELTPTSIDPSSKQPHFKMGAAKVEIVAGG